MVLLNADFRQKRASLYANSADIAIWESEAKGVAAIIDRKDGATKKWDGVFPELTWAD